MSANSIKNLLEETYSLDRVELKPIHLFEFAERGVYRVRHVQGPDFLCRAHRSRLHVAEWLGRSADVLRYLEAKQYPAPRVIVNNVGDAVTKDAEWTVLLLTFIEGTVHVENPPNLKQVGETLAQLHLVDIGDVVADDASLLHCRWQPNGLLADLLEDLHKVASQVPAELAGRYHFCVDTLTKVLAWPELPAAILHADCNNTNAVQTNDGVVLIDWDGAGIGPAIMDLGYLLLNCHIGQHTWPEIVPDQERIRAVLAGYYQQRSLTSVERGVLFDAISFAECHHNAKELPKALQGDWRVHRGLIRFLERYTIVPQIAQHAADICAG